MTITKANRNISDLQATGQVACKLFLEECKKQGLNVLVTETLRTQERQNYLYCQGRTVSECTKKGIPSDFAKKYCNPNANQVTWTLDSNHKNGLAWDICKNIKGQEYNDSSFFSKAGKIAKELGIEWGGTWEESDTPHFQISKGWKKPMAKVPEWQVESLKSVIKKLKLDPEYWTEDKLNNPITIGELMALINKMV